MAKRSDLILSESETVIGSGVKVKGTLVSDGDITIDGQLTGDVKTRGNLTLGVNAVIKANVSSVNLKVAGQLTGQVNCEGETHVTDTGRIIGDITTGSLQIEAGAVFIGNSQMTETEVQEMPDEEPADEAPLPPNS